MMKMRLVAMVLLVVGFGVVGGCGRGTSESKPDVEPQEDVVVDQQVVLESLMKEIDALDGGAAIERMKEIVADKEYAMLKPSIAERLISTILQENDLMAAQDAYLKLAAEDEVIAKAGYGQLLQASTTTNAVDVTGWYEKILLAPVSGSMKAHTWTLVVRSQADAETIMPLVERLDEIVALPENPQSHNVLVAITRHGVAISDFAGLKALTDAVISSVPERSDLVLLMLVTEGDVLLKQGMLAEVETFLVKNGDKLDDGMTKAMVLKLIRASMAKKDDAMAERLAVASLANGEMKPQTRNAVARTWIQNATDIKNPEAFSKRINAALAGGYPQSQLASVFRDGFYMVMTSGNSEIQKSCMDLAQKMYGSNEMSDSARQSIALLLLDGAFYRNDFRAAYELVKGGIPGYDETWHVEMSDKVGAHLALQEKRPADAIALFRKHMERVDGWTEPVINPVNGARMTREAVLGFNEKRIGDIYNGMEGHAEDAKNAYLRSRDWYQKAIAASKEGSIEYKLAVEELEMVP